MGNRIVIIGNAGGGKSTLAQVLQQATGLPLHRLDNLQWKPGWKPAPAEEFKRRHDAIIRNDRWIIDGFASWDSIKSRLEAADTIILIDHALWVHYWWAIKRQFVCLVRPRPDFVGGCPMLPKTIPLLRMIWLIHRSVRPRLIRRVKQLRPEKWVYHIQSPVELNAFIACHGQKNT